MLFKNNPTFAIATLRNLCNVQVFFSKGFAVTTVITVISWTRNSVPPQVEQLVSVNIFLG